MIMIFGGLCCFRYKAGRTEIRRMLRNNDDATENVYPYCEDDDRSKEGVFAVAYDYSDVWNESSSRRHYFH